MVTATNGYRYRRLPLPMTTATDGYRYRWSPLPTATATDGYRYRRLPLPTVPGTDGFISASFRLYMGIKTFELRQGRYSNNV